MVTIRKAQLAQIHAAKKSLALDDESYRALLKRVVGKASTAIMSDKERDAVISEFKRLGWGERQKRSPFKPSHRPEIRKIFGLWKEMSPLLKKAGSKESLRAYCYRMAGVDDPNFLNSEQAQHLIECLKQYQKRLELENNEKK